MNKKSLILFFLFSSAVFAKDCKKPQNWGAPNALTEYEACLKKNNIQLPAAVHSTKKPNECAILKDGSYRCNPKPLRFFEKSKVDFSLPAQLQKESTAPSPAPEASPLPNQ